MSDKTSKDLCALLDGELEASQARFMIRRLGHDRALNDRWRRGHLVRAVLRSERSRDLSGFSERIALAIDVEPAHSGDPAVAAGRAGGSSMGWIRPVAGMAVAASVALVAFNALQAPVTSGVGPEAAPVVEATAPPAARVDQSVVPPAYAISQRATVASGSRSAEAWGNPRLQQYLLQHNEMASSRSSRGLVPYVYLVSTPAIEEPRQPEPAPQDPPAEPAEAGR